jgi:hypothetical protein
MKFYLNSGNENRINYAKYLQPLHLLLVWGLLFFLLECWGSSKPSTVSHFDGVSFLKEIVRLRKPKQGLHSIYNFCPSKKYFTVQS